GQCVTLTPEAVPEFLGVSIAAEAFNLLTGEFTSRPVRAATRRLLWESTAMLAAAVLLLAIGFERRRNHFDAIRNDAESTTSQLYASKLGYKPGSTLPPALQLQAELRTLRKTRVDAPQTKSNRDAAVSLSRVFALWPPNAHAEVDSMQVTPTA